MRWLPFKPNHSLLVVYDPLADAAYEEMERQLDEVGRYYHFARLSEIVSRVRQRKSQGLAAVVFPNARKGVFLKAVPLLQERKIPFALILRPECIGLNKLPPEEEIQIYQKAYGERFNEISISPDASPAEWDSFLIRCRTSLGPLPIQDLDPLHFFGTWGEVVDLPRDLVEFGVHLSAISGDATQLGEDLRFVRQQTGTQVNMAFSCGQPKFDAKVLESLGIGGLITQRAGVVDKNTDPLDLPRWHFER